jgi:hypothetical protein
MSYITAEKPVGYTEQVSSVLISEDDETLVVMTKDFHYIFPAPSPLPLALQGRLHAYSRAEFSSFHVRKCGETYGIVSLTLRNAPEDVLSEAVSQGFTRTEEGATLFKWLEGKRYSAADVKSLQRYALNETYDIEVLVDRGPRIIKTPIYLIRGVLYIAGAALVVPLFYTVCAISSCK